ncbi:hypothetical protein KDA11_05910, partial [Candidatus Saccharibacteria bacterium]|nr:hypothetical protein [Candidatus Saccharibacteria bacterium]
NDGIVDTPLHPDNLVEFEFVDVDYFHAILAMFDAYYCESATFVFSKSRIYIYGDNSSDNKVIKVAIKCEKVSHYYCAEEKVIFSLAISKDIIRTMSFPWRSFYLEYSRSKVEQECRFVFTPMNSAKDKNIAPFEIMPTKIDVSTKRFAPDDRSIYRININKDVLKIINNLWFNIDKEIIITFAKSIDEDAFIIEANFSNSATRSKNTRYIIGDLEGSGVEDHMEEFGKKILRREFLIKDMQPFLNNKLIKKCVQIDFMTSGATRCSIGVGCIVCVVECRNYES